MNQQEAQLLVEMKAEPTTEPQIRAASQFMGSMPYTHLSLLAMAEVCRREFEHEELAQLLTETANKVAELECLVI